MSETQTFLHIGKEKKEPSVRTGADTDLWLQLQAAAISVEVECCHLHMLLTEATISKFQYYKYVNFELTFKADLIPFLSSDTNHSVPVLCVTAVEDYVDCTSKLYLENIIFALFTTSLLQLLSWWDLEYAPLYLL